MKKLIILFDLHCDASMPSGAEEFGGGNMYTRNLLKCLLKYNIQFIYITRKKFPDLEEKIVMPNGSMFYRLDLGDFSYNDKDLLQDFIQISIIQISKILEEYSKDYEFIFHSFYWQSGMLAKHFSEQYYTHFIHSVLSNAERKKIQGATTDIASKRIDYEHEIFNSAKYIICSSQSEYKDLLELYNIEPQKLFITGRWIAPVYYQPSYLPNGDIATQALCLGFPVHYIKMQQEHDLAENNAFWESSSFVYFGRIHENKGVPQIISAWISLYTQNGMTTPALWIVGGTPQQISVFRKKFYSQFNILEKAEKEGKIIWWGALVPEGISTLLLKAKAVIMHSKYEAGGIVVMEAMSQGVPVIATPFGFAKDYIVNGQNGYIVNFNDTKSLTRYMQYFINQPYLSNYLGRNAKATALKAVMNWDFFNMHMQLYQIALSEMSNTDIKRYIEDIPPDSLDVFPYCFEQPADSYIQYICSRTINKQCIEISREIIHELKCIKWIVHFISENCYFYYLYPLINRSSIDTGQKPYVYNSSKRVQEYMQSLPEDCVMYVNNEKGYLMTLSEMEQYI